MQRTRIVLIVGGLVLALLPHLASAQNYGGCQFSKATLRFAGSVEETTRCLLRKVLPKGTGAEAQVIPAWLLERVTRPVSISAAQVKAYLERERIADELTEGIAQGDTPRVRYFVIHDTSSPEEPGETFPPDIDLSSYSGNDLANRYRDVRSKVNLIIARDGHSRKLVQWGRLPRDAATKIESPTRAPAAKAIFVHVENVQPRLKPSGSGWSWKAPVSGLSAAQEKRLALAYIVASTHAGRWLIPAYHFNIDQGLPQGHDDPQNMDLASWVNQLGALEREIAAMPNS